MDLPDRAILSDFTANHSKPKTIHVAFAECMLRPSWWTCRNALNTADQFDAVVPQACDPPGQRVCPYQQITIGKEVH